MSSAPARIAGLDGHGRAPRRSAPRPTSPSSTRTAAVTVDATASVSLSRNNPWHGRTLTGAVVATWLRGRRTAAEGRPLVTEEAWA